MMHAEKLPGRGLTAHYFFTFGVEVQLVGDRKNTRVEQRILHLDVAAPALKLIQKGSVRVFLRFDAINQIVFDDVEPRSVLVSCRDDRRYFVVFQSAEDNLVFRTACSDLAAGRLDMNRFQRAVLKKGQLLKRGKAGALFGDRYAILTPRKLYILHGKVAVFPSNAISLEEATPRFDDAKGTIHLDVCGKEYVFQGSDKEESQDWFVEIARAATSRVSILQWDDATAAKMQAEAQLAEEEEQQDYDELDMQGPMRPGAPFPTLSSGGTGSPSHFTSPEDWEDEEEAPDHHLEAPEPQDLHLSGNRGFRPEPQHMGSHLPAHMLRQVSMGQRSDSSGSGVTAAAAAAAAAAGAHGIGRGVPGRFSSSGGSYVDAAGNVIRLGSGAARTLGSGGSAVGSRSIRHSGSGTAPNRSSPVQQLQQQRLLPFQGGLSTGSDVSMSNASTPRSTSSRQQQQLQQQVAMHSSGHMQQMQQQRQEEQQQLQEELPLGSSSAAWGPLGTIYEVGESDGDLSQPHHSGGDEDAGQADGLPVMHKLVQRQQLAARTVVPPAPPLPLSKLNSRPQQGGSPPAAAAAAAAVPPHSKPRGSPAAAAAPQGGGSSSRKGARTAPLAASLATSAAAVQAAAGRSARRQQQQQQLAAGGTSSDEFFADYDYADDEETPEDNGDALTADEREEYLAEGDERAAADEDALSEGGGQQPQHTEARAPPASAGRNSSRSFHSKGGGATAAAAAAARRHSVRVSLTPKKHAVTATAGFMAPGAQVDLEALTEAVTGRIAQQAALQSTAQHSPGSMHGSMAPPGGGVGSSGCCGAPQCASCQQQSPLQQQQYSNTAAAGTAAAGYTANSMGYHNLLPGSSPQAAAAAAAPGCYQQQQQHSQHPYCSTPLMPAITPSGLHGTGYSYGFTPSIGQYSNGPGGPVSVGLYCPPPAGSTMGNHMAGMPNPAPTGGSVQAGGTYGSGSPAAGTAVPGSTGNTFASTGSTRRTVNWGSGPGVISTSGSGAKPNDSTNGWGRKSLAGLYSTRPHSGNGSILGGTGADASSIFNNGSLNTMNNSGVSTCSNNKISLLAGAAAGGGHSGRLGTAAATAAASSNSSSGVVLGEYIIPSVLRVIVSCPEGAELATRLREQPDLTPHQRCLALMRWAFGVYQQLPEDARMAIPSGPSHHNLKTWAAPDFNTLLQSIYHTQTLLQQEQQAEWIQQQQQQQQQLQQQQPPRSPSSPSSPGSNAPINSPRPLTPEAMNSLAAVLVAALNAATAAATTGSPWQQQQQQQLFGSPAGLVAVLNALSSPAVLNLLAGLGASPASSIAQQLLAALEGYVKGSNGTRRLSALLQEAVQQLIAMKQAGDRNSCNNSSTEGSGTNALNAAHPKQQHSRPVGCVGGRSRSPAQHTCCRHCCRNHQQHLQHHQQQPASVKAAAECSSDNDDSDALLAEAAHCTCTCSSNSSSNSPGGGDSSLSSCSCYHQQQQQDSRGHNPPSSFCALMHPTLNITVRLKEHQLEAAAAAGEDAAAGSGTSSSRPRSHRLRGRCSFTCDNPLFQLDAAAGSAQAAAAAGAGAGSTGVMCRQQGQQRLPVGGQTVITAGNRTCSSGSSNRSSAESLNYPIRGSAGSINPPRCSTVCYLSPAAAETICQAASTAAAAAAAAVRSAVLTLDGEDPPLLGSHPGVPLRPHSFESLVGQVQDGQLDAAGFVEAVAAGRAGPLLRPTSLC